MPKKKGPPTLDWALARERAEGALLGLAVGDAFGTTNEFKRLDAPIFPELCTGLQTEIVGGGPFSLKRGQVTDDTQMATCLAHVLKTERQLDPVVLAKSYRTWADVAFDIGTQTKGTLLLLDDRWPPTHTGKKYWVENAQDAAGNGSLMRTAPIGVFYFQDDKARRAASFDDSAITHFDPRCQLACAAFNSAIAAAVGRVEPELNLEKLVAAAEKELHVAAAELGHRHPEFVTRIQLGSDDLQEDLRLARASDPLLYGPQHHLLQQQGFVRIAFRLAFWELLHAPSFSAAIIDVANRGGDSDTNAAITGALLGATYGAGAIPREWGDTVLQALELDRSPFGTTYHPRELVSLVEALHPVEPAAPAKRPMPPPKGSR